MNLLHEVHFVGRLRTLIVKKYSLIYFFMWILHSFVWFFPGEILIVWFILVRPLIGIWWGWEWLGCFFCSVVMFAKRLLIWLELQVHSGFSLSRSLTYSHSLFPYFFGLIPCSILHFTSLLFLISVHSLPLFSLCIPLSFRVPAVSCLSSFPPCLSSLLSFSFLIFQNQIQIQIQIMCNSIAKAMQWGYNMTKWNG